MPDTVVMKIVENESTAANLLLSGDINAARSSARTPSASRRQAVRRRDARPAWASSGTTTTTATRPATPPCGWRSPRRSTSPSSRRCSTAGAGTPATTLAALAAGRLPGRLGLRRRCPAPGRRRGQGRARDGKPELTFLYSSAAGSAVAAAAELAVQQWKAAGVDGDGQGRGRDRAPGRHLRHRRLGHRLGPAQRQQPRPAGAVPVRPGLADGGTNFSGIDNADYTDGVAAASAMTGTDGLRRLARRRVGAGRRGRHRAVRQQRGEDLRQGRRVRVPGQLRARPASGCWRSSRMVPGELGARRRPPRGGRLGSHPWVRFGVRRLGRLLVSLWVLVTASFLMIHLIPGDPVRGALGPDRAGRPGRGQARGAGPRRPAAGAVLALPAGPVHRRPRHLAGLAAAGLADVVAQRLPGHPAAGAARRSCSRSRSRCRSASRWAC